MPNIYSKCIRCGRNYVYASELGRTSICSVCHWEDYKNKKEEDNNNDL